MPIRSHLGRTFDFSLRSNQVIAVIAAAFGVAGVVAWLVSGSVDYLWAGPQAFLGWALMRELDPDHPALAQVAALIGGGWVLASLPTVSALFVGGMLLAARITLNSTGRRPLLTDLIVIGLYGVAISYRPLGWVAGFSIAVAFYVDDRLNDAPPSAGVLVAGLVALGSSVVATAAGAFPKEVPEVMPLLMAPIGVLGLIGVAREPVQPASLVDSRRKTPLTPDRLHATRSLFGVALFVATLLAGQQALALGSVALIYALALGSAEFDRIRRR